MDIWVNGERRALAEGATVADALVGAPRDGVAVAVDGELVRRADWARTPLTEGTRVEVLTAVQGG